jgi:hypothetical protein
MRLALVGRWWVRVLGSGSLAATFAASLAATLTASLDGLAPRLGAQTFSYPDFGNPAQLNLLGNASINGTALRLTPNTSNQRSWVWRQTPVQITYGFTTTFTFRVVPTAAGTKGEGLVFALHADPLGPMATGGTAWGLGYGSGANASVGLRKSLVLELDTFRDVFLGDVSDNELSLHTNGSNGNHEDEVRSLARTTPATVLSDGTVHTLTLRYATGVLEVFVDGSATPSLTRAWHHDTGGFYANGTPAAGLGLTNGMVTVGFCATTGSGALSELAEVLSWNWSSTSPADPCYAGSLGADVLTVEGATGGPLRTVRLGIAQSFGIGLASPPGYGPGAPYFLFVSLAPQPGALGTQLGFGQTCFPVLPTTANELLLADTFGLLPALLPAAPTPHTLQLPPGLVTVQLDFTVQAVLAATSSPFALGVSNGIDVEVRPTPAPTATSVAPLSAAVGLPIVVTGTNFLPGLQLAAGGVPVVPTTVTSTSITFPYPAGVACNSTLAIVNPDGQGVTRPINPQITITQTAQSSGTAAGGALFVIIGTGFATGTTVTIGGAPATVNTTQPTLITCTTPPGSPGQQPVVVTSPGGCVANTTYTYL